MDTSHPFLKAFRGSFSGILRWPQLDELWQTVLGSDTNGWYIYAVGEPPPEKTVEEQQLRQFISEIDKLLRKEHQEDYCGVVYVDDRQHPEFIKIFDPNNLGVSCGFSDNPPLPGWILAKIPPTDLPAAMPAPGNRKRWWQRLFGKN
jgi:hypothetical protein